MRVTFLFFAVVLLDCDVACGQSRDYQLVEPSLFQGGEFGFSGMVTTDGSTGVISDVSFISSWAINVFTPSDVDGVSSEFLTPRNSTLSFDLGLTSGLVVTANTMRFEPGTVTPVAVLEWTGATSNTGIRFNNRAGTAGSVTVFDASSAFGVGGEGKPIAIYVPEPNTGFLCSLVGATSLLLRPRSHRPTA